MSQQDLTAANSTFSISIPDLYTVPQILQDFVADNPFSTSDIEVAETVVSLEGHLFAGYVPNPISQSITLLPNGGLGNDSAGILVDWIQAQRTSKGIFRANANITAPSLGKVFILTNGVLKTGKVIPDARRIYQAISFTIVWENVVSVGI